MRLLAVLLKHHGTPSCAAMAQARPFIGGRFAISIVPVTSSQMRA